MNTRQIKYVITLADLGSFSVAAEALNISQPSLSQYIKKIETEIGMPLFERSNGNVKTTDAGKVYVETGRKILNLEKNMHNVLADISNNKSGSITVGTTPFRSVTIMPDVTKKFKDKYSGIEIVIREMPTHELLEAAERGEFDLCVTALPVNENIFEYDVVMDEEIVLAVKKDCKLDRFLKENATVSKDRIHSMIDITLLKGKEFVMVPDNQTMQKELNKLILKYDLDLKTAAVVKRLESQIEMVAAGVGSAIVPAGIKKSKRFFSNISCYSFSQEIIKRSLAVAYKKDKYLSKPMNDLIKILKEERL